MVWKQPLGSMVSPMVLVINHWSRWFFILVTIGLDGFAMDFGLASIGLNGFSMVADHWSNDGMVTIHRYGLNCRILLLQDVHQWASTICMTCQKTKNMTYSPPRKASLTLENQGRRAPVLSSYQSTTLTLCLQLHDLGSRQG